MGYALATHTGDNFFVEQCYKCGVKFAMPSELNNTLRETHDYFYCPNGHGQHYLHKSKAEEISEQLAVEQKRTETERKRREWAELEMRSAHRSLSATRGKVTLLKRRMGRGQCPCCKQKFADLHGHMAQQHPGYGEAE